MTSTHATATTTSTTTTSTSYSTHTPTDKRSCVKRCFFNQQSRFMHDDNTCFVEGSRLRSLRSSRSSSWCPSERFGSCLLGAHSLQDRYHSQGSLRATQERFEERQRFERGSRSIIICPTPSRVPGGQPRSFDGSCSSALEIRSCFAHAAAPAAICAAHL